MPVASSNPAFDISFNVHHFHKTKQVSMILLRNLTRFIQIRYLRSVITHAH